MTELTKTRRAYVVLYAAAARPIVVSLEPGDVIGFREAGRRQVWTLPIDRMFRLAVRESPRPARSGRKR